MINDLGKVGNSKLVNTTDNSRNKKTNEEVQTNNSEAKSNSAESVKLSQEAQQLATVQATIDATPEVNEARVEAIKQSVSDGSYTINSEVIAEKMAKDLLG